MTPLESAFKQARYLASIMEPQEDVKVRAIVKACDDGNLEKTVGAMLAASALGPMEGACVTSKTLNGFIRRWLVRVEQVFGINGHEQVDPTEAETPKIVRDFLRDIETVEPKYDGPIHWEEMTKYD